MKKLLVIGVVVLVATLGYVASTSKEGANEAPVKVATSATSQSDAARSARAIIVKDAVPRKRPPQESAQPDPVEYAPGQFGIPNADGSYQTGNATEYPLESSIEGAISVRTMMMEHSDKVRVLQRGLEETNTERDDCLLKFAKRGGKVTAYHEWTIALTFVGDGTTTRVAKVQALADRWPDTFDDTVKDCYLDSYARVRFDSSEKFDITVEYPLCVYPPSADSSKQEGGE